MKLLYSLLVLFLSTNIIAQNAEMVVDLTPGNVSSFDNSDEKIWLSNGNSILFSLYNDSDLWELYMSDGSEAGTRSVMTLGEGEEIGEFNNEHRNYIFFTSVVNGWSRTIYRIDRSNYEIDEVYAPDNGLVKSLSVIQENLYFAHDHELWTYDINLEQASIVFTFDSFRGFSDMEVLYDNLIIIAGDMEGTKLFISDGTEAGTVPYYLLNTGSDFSRDYYMNAVEDNIYFFYNRPSSELIDLFVTDGTNAGTKPIVELESYGFVNPAETRSLYGFNGKYFFGAYVKPDVFREKYLLVAEGPDNAVVQVNYEGDEIWPEYFTEYRGELYFSGVTRAGAFYYVYKTDGSVDGTLRPIDPSGLGAGGTFGGSYMTVFQDELYFSGYRRELGDELWRSDGTTENTFSIDIVPGSESSNPTDLVATDSILFFIAETPEFGRELWKVSKMTSVVSSFKALNDAQFVSSFPNPAKDIVTLRFDTPVHNISDYTIRIVSVHGQELKDQVLSIDQDHINLNVDDLSAGQYYIYLIPTSKSGQAFKSSFVKME